MQKRLLILCLLLVLLAACNGDDEESDDGESTLVATPIAQQLTPVDVPGQQMTPGLRVEAGLELTNSIFYASPAGTGFLVVEVRNTTDAPIATIGLTASLLNAENRELDTQYIEAPFLNIPPGYSMPLSLAFNVPEGYQNYLGLVEIIEGAGGDYTAYTAEYDLPSTVDPLPTSGFPWTVTGTLTNDRGRALQFPLAGVALYDPTGKLLGMANSLVEGLSETGTWEPGTTVTFQATFAFVGGTEVGETRVISAAYSSPE
jgi:hypothetical protein